MYHLIYNLHCCRGVLPGLLRRQAKMRLFGSDLADDLELDIMFGITTWTGKLALWPH